MRTLLSYILAGILAVLLLDVIAPPAGFGLGVAAGPSVNQQGLNPQIVDRSGKSDRLQVPKTSGRQLTPKAAPVLVGCEPVFSALSKDKQANFPGRCLA
jgi:hypothetical protein